MRLTLGDDAALTEETIIETLERVSTEIRQEEVLRTEAAIEKQKSTQKALESAETKNNILLERLYWKCARDAKAISRGCGALIVALLITGLLAGIGIKTSNKWGGWILAIGSGGTLVFSLASFVWGTTIKGMLERIEGAILQFLLKRESKATQLEIRASH